MKTLIAYIRVSTQRQAGSGLGLAAQQSAVHSFADSQNAQIIAQFTEVETGRDSRRPQLAAAIRQAKALGATLVIAKLDRLARSVSFVASLMDSGVEFICCDNPNANRLTIHILAAVAEDEAQRISARTREALAAARARGVKLGAASPNSPFNKPCGADHNRNGAERGWRAASQRSAEVRAERLAAHYNAIVPDMQARRAAGETFEAIAGWLNSEGHRTTRGRSFTATTVMRALGRYPKAAAVA